jgi:hypothetical protein
MIIWIGSVHLGWHYATDGIVGFLMMLILWTLAGRLILRPKTLPKTSSTAPLPTP